MPADEILEMRVGMGHPPRMPRLALLQSRTFASKREAFDRHEQLIREAAAAGANIVVTQELFLTPYFCTREDPALFDLAEPLPGPVTDRLGALAGELGIVLVSSHFERRGPGLHHNTALIHDAGGDLLGIYRKAHIPQDPAFEEKFYFAPGDSGWPVAMRHAQSQTATTNPPATPPRRHRHPRHPRQKGSVPKMAAQANWSNKKDFAGRNSFSNQTVFWREHAGRHEDTRWNHCTPKCITVAR